MSFIDTMNMMRILTFAAVMIFIQPTFAWLTPAQRKLLEYLYLLKSKNCILTTGWRRNATFLSFTTSVTCLSQKQFQLQFPNFCSFLDCEKNKSKNLKNLKIVTICHTKLLIVLKNGMTKHGFKERGKLKWKHPLQNPTLIDVVK